MVPEDPSETAGEESASPAVETAEGVVDTAEAAAPLTSWADLSEEATAPTTAVEPEDLIDLGIEPTAGTAASSGEGAGEVSEFDDLPRFDALSLLTTEIKEESEPATAEQILQELENLAPEVAEDAEPSLETTEHPVEPEQPESDNLHSIRCRGNPI